MPNAVDPAFFLEPSDYSLLVARVAGVRRPVVIEQIREIPLSEKAQVEEILREISAGKPDAMLAALRPAQRLHLATSDEARHYQTPAALQKFAAESPKFSAEQHGWFAITPAREGSGAPWLLAATAPPAHSQSLAPLGELQIKPSNTFDAALYAATAVGTALKLRPEETKVFVIDLGSTTSHAMMVTVGGIESLTPCAISIDAIAEAVQAELALKFKGSAAKLFYNGLYDFSEAGSKIADRLHPVLQASLEAMGGKPTEFFCAGLPAKQQWLAAQLAGKLSLKPFQPDMRAWCQAGGITFSDSSFDGSVPPAWLGFLNFINVQCSAPTAWSAGWTSLDTPPPPALLPSSPASDTTAAVKAPAPPAVAPAPAAQTQTPPAPVVASIPSAVPVAPVAATVPPPPAAPAKQVAPPALFIDPPAPAKAVAPASAPPPAPAKPAAPAGGVAAPAPVPAPTPVKPIAPPPPVPAAKIPTLPTTPPPPIKPAVVVAPVTVKPVPPKPITSSSAVKVSPPTTPVTMAPPTKTVPGKGVPVPVAKVPPSAAQSKAAESSASYPPKPTVAAKGLGQKSAPPPPVTIKPAPVVAVAAAAPKPVALPATKQPIVLPSAKSTRTAPPMAAPAAVFPPRRRAGPPFSSFSLLSPCSLRVARYIIFSKRRSQIE